MTLHAQIVCGEGEFQAQPSHHAVTWVEALSACCRAITDRLKSLGSKVQA